VKDRNDHQIIIFSKNEAAIKSSEIIVAVVDGADVDSGTAWKLDMLMRWESQ